MARGNARANSEQPARRSLADRIGGFQAPDEGATAPLGFIPKQEFASKEDAFAQGVVGMGVWGEEAIAKEIKEHITDLIDSAAAGQLQGYEFLSGMTEKEKTAATKAVLDDEEYQTATMQAQEFEYKVELLKEAVNDKKFNWKDKLSLEDIFPLRKDEQDEGVDFSGTKMKAFARARLAEVEEIADEYRDEINSHQARVIEDFGRNRKA
jgi:hypothetical protein